MKHINRKSVRFIVPLLMLVLSIGLLSTSVVSAQALTHVRIAHFSPDTPAVEVYLNGEFSGIQTLRFGEISGWVELPAGTYSVAVAPAGTSVDQAAIGPANFTLPGNAWITVAAVGSLANGTLGAATISEDYTPIEAGEARVAIFHGIEDAPAVDVILPDGTKLVSNLSFGSGETITVPSGTYDLAVVAAGTTGPAVIDLSGTTLNNQTYYFVAATNTLASPQVALSAVGLGTVAPLIGKTGATQTIAAIAAGDGRFDTLVAALTAADLVDTLNGAGQFTVFAPTDAAFAALPAGTIDALLADKTALTNILLYHVVGGKALASDVVGQSSLNTLGPGSISVTVTEDGVFLNDTVQIIITDIQASNGVIHVIDAVLIP
jgi:uncharacterized surface protein with fasciclin (FAS1) repeats